MKAEAADDAIDMALSGATGVARLEMTCCEDIILRHWIGPFQACLVGKTDENWIEMMRKPSKIAKLKNKRC